MKDATHADTAENTTENGQMRTTIEQHVGDHPTTGLPIVQCHVVITDAADYGIAPGGMDDDATEWLGAVHHVYVAVALLECPEREHVLEALRDVDVDHDYPDTLRSAYRAARASWRAATQ